MNWNNWNEFAAMGGYGSYVWGSVLVVLAFIAGELTEVVLRRRAILKEIRNQS